MKLYDFQQEVLEQSNGMKRVAYYYDMGLGKTFIGADKMNRLDSTVNLVVCQKSKVKDWIEHFKKNYEQNYFYYDLTNKRDYEHFFLEGFNCVGFINYDLLFRRPELAGLKNFTLLLDESSLIQNETSKRSRFILNKLKPENVILLSGTPTGGKYEKLWSQLRLLGWDISKTAYWNRYIDYYINDRMGFPLKVVRGYKNVDELKDRMREYGCFFKKTDEVHNLPEQIFSVVKCSLTTEYNTFVKNGVVTVNGIEFVGDTTLSQLLRERQLCGIHNKNKVKAFMDIVDSTDDRLIVFYNFNEELRVLCGAVGNRPVSIVNGEMKTLDMYEREEDSITFIQYQAGAMGLNLQKANKIVYFTPPLSSELYEQSKKRIHRIGQDKPCFYYKLSVEGSIEEKIYATLALRRDYTEQLFKEDKE